MRGERGWLGAAAGQRLMCVLGGFLVSRMALTIVGLIGMGLLGLDSRRHDFLPDLPWLSLWAQWDAAHYIDIAVEGYTFEPGRLSDVAFFPLYPWLIRLVGLPFGPLDAHGAALIGLVVSNVALLIALVYLMALVERDLGGMAARRAALYVLVFPTTLFLSAVYAEPVFLAAAVASFYHARGGEWYRAGLAGALAALSRPFGFLLLVPLAVEMWRQRARPLSWPALALVPLGLAVFFGYLALEFGDPLVYFRSGTAWGRGLYLPWEVLLGYLQGPLAMFDWPFAWLDLVSVGIMVVLAALAWRTLPASYAAYATIGMVFLVSSGRAWFSAPRHALALFPLILVLVVLGQRYPLFGRAWIVFSILVAAAFMARFAGGHWVT